MSSAPPTKATEILSTLKKMAGTKFGKPVRVSLTGWTLPSGGADISRKLSEPVPKKATAALVFFNETDQLWEPVATTLSADRRTLHAHVTHFSFWDTAEYIAGWVFDKRVTPPKCAKQLPTWVLSTSFLDDQNSPVRWCVGRDPKDSDLLEVKMAVNRSYGLGFKYHAHSEQVDNSAVQGGSSDMLLGQFDRLVAGIDPAFDDRLLVPGGNEATMTFSEKDLRDGSGEPLISAVPSWDIAVVTLIWQALVSAGDHFGGVAAASVALVAYSQCVTSLTAAAVEKDWPAAASSAARCVLDNLETITVRSTAIRVKNLPNEGKDATNEDLKKIGDSTGKYAGRLLLALAVGDIAQPLLTYLLMDRRLDKSGLNLSVVLQPELKRTLVSYQRPVLSSGALNPSYSIVERHSNASCIAGSDIDAPGAYRCFYGHYVIDPCWQLGSADDLVVCTLADYSTQLAALELQHGQLPPPTAFGTSSVVSAVELEDRTKCTSVKGSHDALPDGRVVSFSCTGSDAVLSDLDTGHAVWTAKVVTFKDPGYSKAREVKLRRVWFPRR